MRSVITSKYQTTIPKAVREMLKLSIHDAVEWRVKGGIAEVLPAQRAFFSRRGCIKVGKGNIASDIELARRIRSEHKG